MILPVSNSTCESVELVSWLEVLNSIDVAISGQGTPACHIRHVPRSPAFLKFRCLGTPFLTTCLNTSQQFHYCFLQRILKFRNLGLLSLMQPPDGRWQLWILIWLASLLHNNSTSPAMPPLSKKRISASTATHSDLVIFFCPLPSETNN